MQRLRTPLAHAIAGAALALAAPGVAAADAAADASAGASPAADRPAADIGRGTTLAVMAPADGLTVAVGGPDINSPWVLSPPLRGSSGIQWLHTVRDEPTWLVRVGAGWTEMPSASTMPTLHGNPSHGWNLDGTEFAWRHPGGEWYASVQRRNWGPGWTGNLLLDGAAAPVPAIGWRRPQPLPSDSPWLSWMGPWMADVFIGRLLGHDQPERPSLIGLRLQMQPFARLQFGLSRALQWGGSGRDESFASLLRGLLGRDNVGTSGVTEENEPGNQLGGFDWRWQLGADSGTAFYGQLVGEDENGYLPSAYIVQAGLQARWEIPQGWLLGFVEWNDTIADHADGGNRPLGGTTYRSGVFRQGYTQSGLPLGHPAGGDVTLASVGLLAQAGIVNTAVVVSWGNALPTAQRFAAGDISGLNATLQADIDASQQWGAGLWWWRDTAQQTRALMLWWRGRW